MKMSLKLFSITGLLVFVSACNTGTNTSNNITNADTMVNNTDRTKTVTAKDTSGNRKDTTKSANAPTY